MGVADIVKWALIKKRFDGKCHLISVTSMTAARRRVNVLLRASPQTPAQARNVVAERITSLGLMCVSGRLWRVQRAPIAAGCFFAIHSRAMRLASAIWSRQSRWCLSESRHDERGG